MVFEFFLYKRASCVDEYCNRETLEQRILRIARKMFVHRHPLLFVFFGLMQDQ